MRNPFIATWDYFRNSWEDDHGHFSFKRASAFIFVFLMVYMIVRDRISTQWAFYTFLTVAILFALIVAIITVSQLIRLAKTGLFKASPLNTYNDEEDNNLSNPEPPAGPLPV